MAASATQCSVLSLIYLVGIAALLANPEGSKRAMELMEKGEHAKHEGSLEAAQLHFTEALTIRKELAKADPTNHTWLGDLSHSHISLGDLALKLLDLDAADRHYNESHSIREKLVATDPHNNEWRRYHSAVHGKKGDLALAKGELKVADRQYGELYEIATNLIPTTWTTRASLRSVTTRWAISPLPAWIWNMPPITMGKAGTFARSWSPLTPAIPNGYSTFPTATRSLAISQWRKAKEGELFCSMRRD